MAASMGSKLEPAGWTVVLSYGRTVTKTKFSPTDGLSNFLSHGALRELPRLAELRNDSFHIPFRSLFQSPREHFNSQIPGAD